MAQLVCQKVQAISDAASRRIEMLIGEYNDFVGTEEGQKALNEVMNRLKSMERFDCAEFQLYKIEAPDNPEKPLAHYLKIVYPCTEVAELMNLRVNLLDQINAVSPHTIILSKNAYYDRGR